MTARRSIQSFFTRVIGFLRHYIPYPTLNTAGFLLLSLLIPSNKLLFVLVAVYLALQFFITRSFVLTILYSLVPLSLMEVGQTYVYQAIPVTPELIWNPDYIEGRQLFFIFSPYWLFLITCAISVGVLHVSRKYQWHTSPIMVVLLLLAGLDVFSAVQSEFFPELSVAYAAAGLGVVAWLWMAASHLQSQSAQQRKNRLSLFFQQIVVVGIFHSLVGIIQFFSRSPLGLTIERTQRLAVFGLGADESFLQFRPVGLFEHANSFANHLLILLLSALILQRLLAPKQPWLKKLLAVFYALTVGTIILTLSRAAYLALAIFGIGLFFWSRQTLIRTWKAFWQWFTQHKLYGYLAVLILFYVILNRGIHSLYSFGSAGGFSVRSELVELSVALAKKYWWFGTGGGMFIPAGFHFNPSGVMRYFPEAVHNGFLLFFVERGFWATLTMGAFVYLLVRKVLQASLANQHKKLILLGFVSLATVMLFHPLTNFLSLYTLVVLLLL